MSHDTDTASGSALWRYVTSCRQMTAHDRRNSLKATGWLFLWAVTFVSAMAAIRFEVLPPGATTYLVIASSTLVGLLAVAAYVRFVREADELQHKIQTEAFSLGFGGGFLATFTLSLLERSGVYQADLGDPFLAMVAFYLLGIFLAARRYA